MTFFQIFLSTMTIMILAEFADKTSLVAISLTTKFGQPGKVFIGSIIGIATTSIIGIFLAIVVGEIIPRYLIFFAGLIFIVLGIMNLKDSFNKADPSIDEGSNTKNSEDKIHNITLQTMWMVALAEFGDKSQIFLFARTLVDNPIPIFFGAIIGMAIVLAVSIYFGDKIIDRVPAQHIEKIVGSIFIIVGIWLSIGVLYSSD